MGGDHKCPVCQATFTRPQHVARHMRSHTGDRPYKCQYCGDQFARSDLLSRHVNKCHANEKPVPAQGSRRKGSASASRATTSKQACDQCVQSSLPCDGSNPCAKCVQRKCRCTYVKFHRQTAPLGPGHNPRPAVPPNAFPGPPSASRIPISYPPDEFFLAPAPSSSAPGSVPVMTDTLYSSSGFSFTPLYSEASSGPDFTTKYRAQAELLRGSSSSSAHFAPTGGTTTATGGGGGAVGPGIPGTGSSLLSPPNLYSSDPRSGASSSWVGQWGHDNNTDSYHPPAALHDKHGRYVNSQPHGHGIPHALSSSYLRRGSVDFGTSGSEESASTGQHSIPSSAASSNVHLPLDGLPMGYNPLENLSTDHHRGDFNNQQHHEQATTVAAANSQRQQQQRQSGLEAQAQSAFGLTSLDDPNLFPGFTTTEDSSPSFFPPPGMNLSASNMNMPLTGLSSISGIPADDPDATPMPLKEICSTGAPSTLPARSSSTDGSGLGAGAAAGTTRGEGDLRELREFWKQYMRTPLSAENPLSSTPQQQTTSPGFRRPRVASMPSSKTPTIALTLQQQNASSQQGQGRGESGVRTTLQDDLRSYEAAVLARKAPTTLNLVPKTRRGTVPGLPPSHGNTNGIHHHHSSSPVDFGALQHAYTDGENPAGAPMIKFDHNVFGRESSRPSSSSTNRSGSSGEGSVSGAPASSSSLAGAFGGNHHHHRHGAQPPTYAQHQQQSSPRISPSRAFTHRRGSPASSTTGGSSSRASSVSVDHGADDDGDIEINATGSGPGNDQSEDEMDEEELARRNVDSVGRLRPSFKRLASATLGRPDVKRRQFLVPPGGVQDGTEGIGEGGVSMDTAGGGMMGLGGLGVGVEGFAPGALGMH